MRQYWPNDKTAEASTVTDCHHYCYSCRTYYSHAIRNVASPIDTFKRFCVDCALRESQKIKKKEFSAEQQGSVQRRRTACSEDEPTPQPYSVCSDGPSLNALFMALQEEYF